MIAAALPGAATLGEIAIVCVAAAGVTILPGFGIRSAARSLAARRGGRPIPPRPADPAELVLGIAWTAIVLALAGGALLAFGAFSTTAIGVVALVLGLIGVVPFLRWSSAWWRGWDRGRWGLRLALAFLVVLTLPWVHAVLVPGYPPSGNYQFYYWHLGTQLAQAGGIPAWVNEYEQHVRWLPDYVLFNVSTDAYRWLSVGVSETAALQLWRIPAAFLGLTLFYVVLRLWFGRPAAFVGSGAVAASSNFFLVKFSSLWPEEIAIVLGLAAVWLVVSGLRRDRRSWVVLAGALLGVAVGVHAIGATVCAMLVVAAGALEWLALRRSRKSPMALGVAAAAVAAVAVIAATGWTLQSRAFVASDAVHPRPVQGRDPTLTFLNRQSGSDFDRLVPVPPVTVDQPIAQLRAPWAGTKDLPLALQGLALAGLVLGLALALALGDGPVRRGIGSTLGLLGLLVAGIAFFALAFDTFVPQHTGIGRLGNYLSLVLPLFAGGAAEGLLLGWARLTHRSRQAAWSVIAAVGMVCWAVPAAVHPLDGGGQAGGRLTADGERALAVVRREARPDDTVLFNAETRGCVSFFSGHRDPLEGHQPTIEAPGFLAAANRYLSDAHRYFEQPSDRGLARRLGAKWLIVADDPTTLGSARGYGGSMATFASQPYLDVVYRTPHVTVLHNRDPVPVDRHSLGPAKPLGGRFALAALGLAVLFGVLLGAERIVARGGRMAAR